MWVIAIGMVIVMLVGTMLATMMTAGMTVLVLSFSTGLAEALPLAEADQCGVHCPSNCAGPGQTGRQSARRELQVLGPARTLASACRRSWPVERPERRNTCRDFTVAFSGL